MKQRGIALLLVLSSILLMSAMVSATYFYLSNIIYFAGDSRTKQDEKQLLLGSEDFFINNIIKEILIDGSFSRVYIRLLTTPSTIRINNVNVHYRLIDRTNCFNINTLYGYFNNTNKYNGYYAWLVLRNILQLNDITSSVLNEIMIILSKNISGTSNLVRIDGDWGTIEQALQMGNTIDQQLNISSENFSLIAPLLCSRNDNKLLININMLDVKNSILMQAIFMSEITQSNMNKAILSKPLQGWGTVESFFRTLANNSKVDRDRINELKRVSILKFSHKEYYFSSNFQIDNSDSQLMSLFHVRENAITVLQRRFIL